MKATDREIFESFFDDASPALKERVARAVEADSRTAEIHAFWSRVHPLLSDRAQVEKAISERAIAGVMQRLAAEPKDVEARRAGPVQFQTWATTMVRGWRWMAGAGAAIAAAALLALVIPWTEQEDAASPMRSAKQQESVESSEISAESVASANLHRAPKTVVVDYRLARGVTNGHFASLAEALNVVQQGDTIRLAGGRTNENVRIATPIFLIGGDGD